MEFFYFAFVVLIGAGVVGHLIESNNKKKAEAAGARVRDRGIKDYKKWKRGFERKYPDYLKKGFPNNQEQLDRELQQLLKANEKHWNALKKSNDKKDKTLKDWIASNARLWVDLDKQQQAEILAGGIAEAKKQWGSNPRYRR